MVQSLGIVIFQALDYGFSDTEERLLSAPLERLIERMTGCDVVDENRSHLNQSYEDEGIVHDEETHPEQITFEEVIQVNAGYIYYKIGRKVLENILIIPRYNTTYFLNTVNDILSMLWSFKWKDIILSIFFCGILHKSCPPIVLCPYINDYHILLMAYL